MIFEPWSLHTKMNPHTVKRLKYLHSFFMSFRFVAATCSGRFVRTTVNTAGVSFGLNVSWEGNIDSSSHMHLEGNEHRVIFYVFLRCSYSISLCPLFSFPLFFLTNSYKWIWI